jgi:hypothetical protein
MKVYEEADIETRFLNLGTNWSGVVSFTLLSF